MGYGMEAVPPPSSYAGGPPSYGGPTRGYGGDAPSTGGRGGRGGGYDGGSAPRRQEPSYGDAPAEKVKQCDENCDETRDNTSIYINNLPPDVTTDELKDLLVALAKFEKSSRSRVTKISGPIIYRFTLTRRERTKVTPAWLMKILAQHTRQAAFSSVCTVDEVGEGCKVYVFFGSE
ncbi:transcription initiation factor TFIID subunit 15b-like [Raphanus sativus]|uniref:Transcription initiation factor TFIID subunit 15b-like n=1 Tax=Raphanus sativus TaxID=3726 RepID=A0A9W3BXG6_RAPSA|nr:transcription initiation factor TFIID subunit 15b-like [Raphanus sativus]XP_056844000.1 transcription initiation factor TFIID subunit 15b-like [Raphanus sativus]XP_056844001.1 transcription initiation factor TFIID subunit 15b-like [Raphanus sativus]